MVVVVVVVDISPHPNTEEDWGVRFGDRQQRGEKVKNVEERRVRDTEKKRGGRKTLIM
jgi:hypothetical protein